MSADERERERLAHEWAREHERQEEQGAHPKSVTRPETGTRLSATEIHENVFGSADEELERPSASLLWSALNAGLTIGFSFLAGAFLRVYTPDHLDALAGAAAYPLGFIFVVRARSELFTENTLEPVIPLLERRDARTLRQVLRLWALLIIGNLVGCAIFALVMARTAAVEAPLRSEMLRMAAESTTGSFGMMLYKGIFAGWLLALLTWLLASTSSASAQIALIWLATAPIAAFHFKHSIVGSAEAFYRAAAGTAGWGEMLAGFTVPTLIGNAIGGVVIVALLNHAQVTSQRKGGA
ncbi:MAG TPA: formate/nitrite transporter family protein [Gemmatimonadaceae bacterium]|nr:formate/nitrite transporter family protein [Gemmatimonadaceae bacterium]